MSEPIDWRAALKEAFDRGALEYMHKGLKSSGWPMIDGEMVTWSDWLILTIERLAATKEGIAGDA